MQQNYYFTIGFFNCDGLMMVSGQKFSNAVNAYKQQKAMEKGGKGWEKTGMYVEWICIYEGEKPTEIYTKFRGGYKKININFPLYSKEYIDSLDDEEYIYGLHG